MISDRNPEQFQELTDLIDNLRVHSPKTPKLAPLPYYYHSELVPDFSLENTGNCK